MHDVPMWDSVTVMPLSRSSIEEAVGAVTAPLVDVEQVPRRSGAPGRVRTIPSHTTAAGRSDSPGSGWAREVLASGVWLRVLRRVRYQGARREIPSDAWLGAAARRRVLFATLVLLWLTSSLWFFRQIGIEV